MEWDRSQVHSKTILHIAIDNFYTQVELLRRPHLQNEPVAVKQKNAVVTCNYKARKFGVKQNMLISEAVKLCPQLLLFNSENLFKYRQASNQICFLLLSYSSRIERSGLDENYLDLTELVKERESKQSKWAEEIAGHCEGDLSQDCLCGCHQRLIIGSQIAHEIRTKLLIELGFTSCCGISYNKLLAKVACFPHKPNQQTTLLPNGALKFLKNLSEVEKFPRAGEKMKQLLEVANIEGIKDLQEIDFRNAKNSFSNKENVACTKKNLGLDLCDSAVNKSGKINSIGIENDFRKISVQSDVKAKFKILLQRLMALVEKDGRMPMTVKVTIRNHSIDREIGNKETKQSPIPSCLFSSPLGKLTEDSANKLLNIIMGLFCKMVNTSKPFHITLLGLAFSKFHEKVSSHSIASFLLKKGDLSVQSLTNFVSNEITVDVMNLRAPAFNVPESDSDSEPSPKKTKLDVFVKSSDLGEKDVEMYSPSKLNVENLNLNENLSLLKDQPIDPSSKVVKDLRQDIIREWRRTYLKPSST